MGRKRFCSTGFSIHLLVYASIIYSMFLIMTFICTDNENAPKDRISENNRQIENNMAEEMDIGRQIGRREQPINIKSRSKIHESRNLKGPGEMGRGVFIDTDKLSRTERKKWIEGLRRNSFNQYISDMISVERFLPDYRFPECKNITYEDLPQVSVVIPFVNESFSVLARTVHSILNRSPPHLLKEIVLCDDASKMEHLGERLENYMADYEKVSIRRLKKRGGLINARILGFNHSTAPVVIFMDSHCEVTTGWLEPLLDRIKKNDRTVVSPVIDTIDHRNFQYRHDWKNNQAAIGDMDWSLTFRWKSTVYNNPRTLPLRTPTIVGCFIAVSRRFFSEVGMFDPGFFIWGGENLEISFKAWMCGDGLEIVPCSRVGHVFKPKLPYSWEGKYGPVVIERNLLRLAEVWLDDYKEFFYQLVGQKRVSSIKTGDYSERVALRKRLGCKDFSWYLQHALPDVFLPSECYAWGSISKGKKSRQCLDVVVNGVQTSKKAVKTKQCASIMYNQQWYFCGKGFIRRQKYCLIPATDGIHVTMEKCKTNKPELIWQYRNDNTIYNVHTNTCLHTGKKSQDVMLKPCNGSVNQRWQWTRAPPPGPLPSWRQRGPRHLEI